MNRTLSTLVGALLLAGATALHAQTPPADAGRAKPRAMRDCTNAPDPKACEERRQKIRTAREDARKACEGAKDPERRDCMRKSMCARTPDPAKCEARAKERAERKAKRMQERKSAGDAKK